MPRSTATTSSTTLLDIGIAVGSPRGLVVPILRDADQLSLAQIEKKIAEFGGRPRMAS